MFNKNWLEMLFVWLQNATRMDSFNYRRIEHFAKYQAIDQGFAVSSQVHHLSRPILEYDTCSSDRKERKALVGGDLAWSR